MFLPVYISNQFFSAISFWNFFCCDCHLEIRLFAPLAHKLRLDILNPLWPVTTIFAHYDLLIITQWYHSPLPPYYHYTLQDFKLQGIKVCNGVVFSRYSQIIYFATSLVFFKLLHRTCIAQWWSAGPVFGRSWVWTRIAETYSLLVYDLCIVLRLLAPAGNKLKWVYFFASFSSCEFRKY